ncbi:MAG: hypothetical protein V4726_02595 [Verrucomicrobiota bacterium]
MTAILPHQQMNAASPARLTLQILAFGGSLCSPAGTAKAALTFSNLKLTSVSFSVDILGTMPATPPVDSKGVFYFVNPVSNASPGFARGNFAESDSRSFIGAQSFRTSFGMRTGGLNFGDYLVAAFEGLSPGEVIEGTLSGRWASAAFDVSQVSSLNVFWGSNESLGYSGATTGGVLVGDHIPVNANPAPEASSPLMLGLTGLLTLRRRR